MEKMDAEQKKIVKKVIDELAKQDNRFCKMSKILFVSQWGDSLDVYFFFTTTEELNRNIDNGDVEILKSVFNKKLYETGYFSLFNSEIRYVFDSYENVKNNYKGNYYLRLL